MSDEGEGVTLPEGWVIDDQEMEWDHHQPPWDDVLGTLLPSPEPTGRFKLTIHGHRVEESPRSEYPLQTVTTAAGCTVVNDTGVTLVPAHSLRTGDEVEWAPSDWRAIRLCDIDVPVAPWVFFRAADDNPVRVAGCALVAVRRSGVTG